MLQWVVFELVGSKAFAERFYHDSEQRQSCSPGRRINIFYQTLLSKKKFRAYIASFIVGTAIVAGAAIFWHKTMYHFKTVDAGKVYRSGTLSNIGLKIAHELYGIKTIVNLRSEGEMQRDWYARQKEFARSNEMNMVDIPMLPDTPPDPAQIDQFMSVVSNPDMLPVLIHCQAGIIRTGMMVSVYRIGVLGESNGTVMAELPWFGRTFEERPAVKDFILSYSP